MVATGQHILEQVLLDTGEPIYRRHSKEEGSTK